MTAVNIAKLYRRPAAPVGLHESDIDDDVERESDYYDETPNPSLALSAEIAAAILEAIGQSPEASDVLYSGTSTIPSTGRLRLDFRESYASVGVWAVTPGALSIAVDEGASLGAGRWRLAATERSLVVPLTGTTLVVDGTPGQLVSLFVSKRLLSPSIPTSDGRVAITDRALAPVPVGTSYSDPVPPAAGGGNLVASIRVEGFTTGPLDVWIEESPDGLVGWQLTNQHPRIIANGTGYQLECGTSNKYRRFGFTLAAGTANVEVRTFQGGPGQILRSRYDYAITLPNVAFGANYCTLNIAGCIRAYVCMSVAAGGTSGPSAAILATEVPNTIIAQTGVIPLGQVYGTVPSNVQANQVYATNPTAGVGSTVNFICIRASS